MIKLLLIIVIAFILAVALFALFRRGKSSTAGRVQSGGNNQVYVGNLAYRVTEHQLRALFSPYGRILRLKVVRDSRTRRSKGYGFVTFHSASDAQKALTEHGKDYKGRALVVRIAKEK